MKKQRFTFRLGVTALSLLFIGVGSTVIARQVETSPVPQTLQRVFTGKGVIEHGRYNPLRDRNKVREYVAPEADAWTKALPDTLVGMLLESDNSTFNPNQTGMYTFNEETGLVRMLTTSNTSRVHGMAYGDLRLTWTYKNNASEDNHVWYTRSYFVKKYSSGTLNTTDQKYRTFDDTQDNSTVASAIAYDPETGMIFGCFKNKGGTGYEYAKMDNKFVDEGRSKAICELDAPWQACGFTAEGKMYAVLSDGKLASVDKYTGATTVVKDLGLAGNDSEAGFLDTRDNLFYIYWSNRTKGEAALYVVDINDGCNLYKAVTMPFYAKMGALVSLHNPVKDDAPGMADQPKVSFNEGSLKGNVEFTAPLKTLKGDSIAGEMSYTVAAGGKVLASGTCMPGAVGMAAIELPEAGSYYVRVRFGNSEGTGLWSKTTSGVWAGPDVPVAPANVKADYDRAASTMKISWDKVSEGTHKGSVSPADVRYTVVKYVEGERVSELVKLTSDSVCTEKVEWPKEISTVKYEVIATYEGADGEGTMSNPVVLGTIQAPWKEDFSAATSLDHFTCHNDGQKASGTGNSTQNVWFRYVNPNNPEDGAAQIYRTSKKNHYLVTPPIHMEPGKSYIFHAEASGNASSYEEKVEVLMGKGTEVADLTTVIVPETSVKAISSNPVILSKEIQVEEEGEYHIAFHATSAAYKRFLQIDNIEVEAPYTTYGPNVPTDLALDGFRYDGSNKVTVSFKAPALDMQGEALKEITKIEVERDGELVKTITDALPGEVSTFEDICPARGTYTYNVTAYNSFGPGKYITGSVETGVDFGAKVTNVVISEPQEGFITIKWTPATTDVKGRDIDPSLIKYTVVMNNQYIIDREFLPSTTNELTFQAINPGYQLNCYCTIYSVTDAGYNMLSASRFDPASYASSVTIPVGTPYKMPIFEDGQVAITWGYDTSGGQWWGSWYPEWSVVSPLDAKTLGIETPDGDGYCFAWPVAFNQNYGNEYSIYEDAKSNFYSGKVRVDDSSLSAFSFQYYTEPATEGTTRDEYIFYPIVRTPYDGIIALSSPISTNDATTGGWHTVQVSLDRFRGQDIQLGIHVEFAGYAKQYNKYFLLDDMQIRRFADNDMMAVSLDVPMLEPGEENILSANMRNLGTQKAESFVVELYRNGAKVSESEPTTMNAGERRMLEFKQTPELFWDKTQKFSFKIAYDKDELAYNNTSDEVRTTVFESRFPAVKDLYGEAQGMNVSLSWSAPEKVISITDDCEDYTSFAINNAGRWSFIDADGLTTAPVVGAQFPGFGEPSAFVVWENVDSTRNFAHSGNKCFAAFPVDIYNDDDHNDDWLISPRLNGQAQNVSFWAFSNFGGFLGADAIEVLVSSTGKNIADFTKVGETITLGAEYAKYSFDIPEGTLYFAIRHTVGGVSAMFIDDITFSQLGNNADVEGYDVYCNGEKANEMLVAEPVFSHRAAREGTMKYHVVACYKDGKSDLSNEVAIATSEVAAVEAVSAKVYATPGCIHIEDASDAVAVVNAQGVTVSRISNPSAAETVEVVPGVYMVTIGNDTRKVIVK